jgi:hypothetical protein
MLFIGYAVIENWTLAALIADLKLIGLLGS